MTEQYIDTIKQMRKKVFEDTMEQLKIMKKESDKTFGLLINTHNFFEFILEDDDENPIIEDPDDYVLNSYFLTFINELNHGDNGYKKQFELMHKLLEFLDYTFDNLLKPYCPELPSCFDDEEEEEDA